MNYQHSLLPDKKGRRYISIFKRILNLRHMNNICLNPKFVTIDFEQAAINGMELIFSNATIKRGNFHFNKCIYTKLQDLGHSSTINQVIEIKLI